MWWSGRQSWLLLLKQRLQSVSVVGECQRLLKSGYISLFPFLRGFSFHYSLLVCPDLAFWELTYAALKDQVLFTSIYSTNIYPLPTVLGIGVSSK